MRHEHDWLAGGTAVDLVDALRISFAGASSEAMTAGVLAEFSGRAALVSSFGADSAVLLHMVSRIDRDLPVLLVDTLMLFPETLEYQRTLSERLGLRNVEHVQSDPADLLEADPDATLRERDPDACCGIRKVAPLERALAAWPVVITGRKRFQSHSRAKLDVFEPDGSRLRVNPLAAWSAQDLGAYVSAHALPRHPLVARGYPSIGCAPCTTRVEAGEEVRAGRWRGSDKVECGIHFGAGGRILRAS